MNACVFHIINRILIFYLEKKMLRQRKNFILMQTIYLRTNITIYYKLLLRKFFRFQTRKSYYRDVSLYNKDTKLKINKKVPRGNILTYFLIRRSFKIRRKKRIVRFKQIHWAVPKYIHFNISTLTTIFLYFPKTNEIHYSFRSFRCSLTKIISFYKSLGI